MTRLILSCVFALFTLAAFARSDSAVDFPHYDYHASCKAETQDDMQSYTLCLSMEQHSLNTLKQLWPQLSPQQQRHCIDYAEREGTLNIILDVCVHEALGFNYNNYYGNPANPHYSAKP